MARRSPAARLTDMVEAIDLIRDEMAGVTLDAFQPDMRKRWLIEGRERSCPEGICQWESRSFAQLQSLC